jgi:hypothetical protein
MIDNGFLVLSLLGICSSTNSGYITVAVRTYGTYYYYGYAYL